MPQNPTAFILQKVQEVFVRVKMTGQRLSQQRDLGLDHRGGSVHPSGCKHLLKVPTAKSSSWICCTAAFPDEFLGGSVREESPRPLMLELPLSEGVPEGSAPGRAIKSICC